MALSRRIVFTLSPDTYADRELMLLTVKQNPSDATIRAARDFIATLDRDLVESWYDGLDASEIAVEITRLMTEAGFRVHVCRVPVMRPLITL